jgi:hypothetical protein
LEGEITGIRRPKNESDMLFLKGMIEKCYPDDFSVFDWIEFDDGEIEVLKSVWSKSVIAHFYGRHGFEGAIEAGYWEKYAGLTKEQSDVVNGIIFLNVIRKNYSRKSIAEEIAKTVGIDIEKAELIVSTELAHIMNKAREIAYREKTKVEKFRYVNSKDACEVCRAIAERVKKGVTLDELKEIVKEVAGEKSREYIAHPRCRCYIKAVRPARWYWE